MARIAMITRILVDTGDNDPGDACLDMEAGLDNALSHFPKGEVVGATIDGYEEPTEDEISGYFEE